MFGSYLKLINAQQGEVTHAYENTKEKVHKTNGAIWSNKMCLFNHLTPSYIKITIDVHNQECRNTKKAATTYRTKQKLEFFTRISQKFYLYLIF